MPLTADMRRSIDQIRDYLFGGGYPDPMSNAEQLSFLFFFYLFESIDDENQQRAAMLNQPCTSLFSGDWTLRNPATSVMASSVREGSLTATVLQTGTPTVPRSLFRWSVWAADLSGDALVHFVRDEVFPFFTEIGEAGAHNFMRGARLGISEPTVLAQVISLVDGLGLDQADSDTKGDLFEHVLRQIKQAGELGQFRTPRHIIRSIVEMIDPQVGETLYDPAAGTAGFLVAAYNHIRLTHSSPEAIVEAEVEGKLQRRGLGDRLQPDALRTLQGATFFGNDVDPKMVRLATMNLALRGLPNVRILQRNVLTTAIDEERRAELGLPAEGFHVVLANPPFSGRVDKDRIVEEVRIGTTSSTELLFLKYMLDSLRPDGRAAVIVPEGVLFGSTAAHKTLRRQLVEDNRVDAVLSLPGGVFQPYSGVKTSVLFFRKGSRTRHVLFLHTDDDGYELDANHDTPIAADDLPHLSNVYARREEAWTRWEAREPAAEWDEKWWFADAAALGDNDYNLSAGRYRPMSEAQAEHQSPRELLDELSALEDEIAKELETLRIAMQEFGP
ncbi:putative type I restriction enzymeP M protein [Variovorax sp. SRS16]|uniref:HsdM family class I SAM-dependent methyltransferase n=1 Tax=Variovorax sp. SRS16 TaxID=282217 RepID=UPI001316D0FE|nr:class I SAM-dependent DNA methyltransferase [Variovorax sp. SRS16]VTU23991.1 putative type I restriction enzymeP M protein [Variovorax sp. SRS16]